MLIVICKRRNNLQYKAKTVFLETLGLHILFTFKLKFELKKIGVYKYINNTLGTIYDILYKLCIDI